MTQVTEVMIFEFRNVPNWSIRFNVQAQEYWYYNGGTGYGAFKTWPDVLLALSKAARVSSLCISEVNIETNYRSKNEL